MTHRLNLSCLTALLLVTLMATSAMAKPEVHVFELENRSASSLLPQLQSLYQGEDIVFSPDGQKLMVRAEAEQLAEIDQLLNTLDVPARQLRIRLRELRGGQENSNSRSYSTQRQSEQSLTMQDGQVASIRSGEIRRVPVAVRGGRDPAAILEEVDLTSGFLVQPNVLSEQQVELQITAIRNDPVVGMPGHETAAVVTLRRVSPGEWVTLGEESSRRQSDGRRVISTETASDRRWQIQVELLD
ncbi:MAG: secretin N-terminal domain-containing protein [Oleiphilaceae bacterium]|nr:secretin N-terminal domain-containing protein [Oleiphilaceae bacterium]